MEFSEKQQKEIKRYNEEEARWYAEYRNAIDNDLPFPPPPQININIIAPQPTRTECIHEMMDQKTCLSFVDSSKKEEKKENYFEGMDLLTY